MIVDRRVAALLFSSTRLTVATPPSFSVPTTELRRRICEPRCAACILVAANERSFSSFSLSTLTTFDHSLAASDATLYARTLTSHLKMLRARSKIPSPPKPARASAATVSHSSCFPLFVTSRICTS